MVSYYLTDGAVNKVIKTTIVEIIFDNGSDWTAILALVVSK